MEVWRRAADAGKRASERASEIANKQQNTSERERIRMGKRQDEEWESSLRRIIQRRVRVVPSTPRSCFRYHTGSLRAASRTPTTIAITPPRAVSRDAVKFPLASLLSRDDKHTKFVHSASAVGLQQRIPTTRSVGKRCIIARATTRCLIDPLKTQIRVCCRLLIARRIIKFKSTPLNRRGRDRIMSSSCSRRNSQHR